MLELARPEAREHTQTLPQQRRVTWGVVDVILGVVMFPFGVWMLLIEGLVHTISALFDRS